MEKLCFTSSFFPFSDFKNINNFCTNWIVLKTISPQSNTCLVRASVPRDDWHKSCGIHLNVFLYTKKTSNNTSLILIVYNLKKHKTLKSFRGNTFTDILRTRPIYWSILSCFVLFVQLLTLLVGVGCATHRVTFTLTWQRSVSGWTDQPPFCFVWWVWYSEIVPRN